MTFFLAIGYYLGEGWERVAKQFDTVFIVAAVVVALAGFGWWWLRRRKA